jgi:hypothetical protein
MSERYARSMCRSVSSERGPSGPARQGESGQDERAGRMSERFTRSMCRSVSSERGPSGPARQGEERAG